MLLVAAGTDPTTLHTGLSAFPDIAAVDYFNAQTATPTLAQLTNYDAVVVMSGYSFANATAMGNVLADYVDSGGAVIEAVAAIATGGGWELSGRLVTGGYEPFVHGPAEFIAHSLGTNNASHPIMQGVANVTDSLPAAVSLATNAQWVASWNNGRPLVAVADSGVVGINIYAFNDGSFGGDVVRLFHNAVVYRVVDPAFSLVNVPSLPYVLPPSGSLTVDVRYQPTAVGANAAAVAVDSNDLDEPRVQVQLSGNAIADYLQITPTGSFTSSGSPGGPFTPSEIVYTLTNSSASALNWDVTHTQSWLTVSASSGALSAGSAMTVTGTFNAAANLLVAGQYADSLMFSNYTSGVMQPRNVSLTVQPPWCSLPAYVRSTVGAPWGSTANETAMDRVFGTNSWRDLRYETVDVACLFSPATHLVFLEGSDNNATELEAFLNANIATIQNWVADRG